MEREPTKPLHQNSQQIILDLRNHLFSGATPQSTSKNFDRWPKQLEYLSRNGSNTKKINGFKPDPRVNTPLSALMSPSKAGTPFYKRFNDFKQFKQDVLRRGQFNAIVSQ